MARSVSGWAAFCIVGVVTGMITTDKARAQWVSVGGGGVHVRAPFVRVDVGPYGGISVRAPFTAIDTPGPYYPYGPPPVIIERRIVQPSLPTAAELAAMDDESLRRVLAMTADRLNARLSRFDTGATWQRYLLRFTDEAIADFWPGSESSNGAIAESLERFRFVASQPEYRIIAELPAFVAMQSVLGEMEARNKGAGSGGDAASEELPLPQPEQPRRDGRFFQPDSR
jgi:hypothetical protein